MSVALGLILILAGPAEAEAVGRGFFAAATAGDRDQLAPLLHPLFSFIAPDTTQDRAAFLEALEPRRLPPGDLTVDVHGPVALVVRPMPGTGRFNTRFVLLLAHVEATWQALLLAQVSVWAGPDDDPEVDADQLRAVAEQMRSLARRSIETRAEGSGRILALAQPGGVVALSSDDGLCIAPADDVDLADALIGTAAEPLEDAETDEWYGFFVGYAARPVERVVDGEARPGWQFVLVGLEPRSGDWRVRLYVEVDTPER